MSTRRNVTKHDEPVPFVTGDPGPRFEWAVPPAVEGMAYFFSAAEPSEEFWELCPECGALFGLQIALRFLEGATPGEPVATIDHRDDGGHEVSLGIRPLPSESPTP